MSESVSVTVCPCGFSGTLDALQTLRLACAVRVLLLLRPKRPFITFFTPISPPPSPGCSRSLPRGPTLGAQALSALFFFFFFYQVLV